MLKNAINICSFKNHLVKFMLYIICTPIGNLNDFSLRSINTLKEVDNIFAEDTRVAAKLLQHFDIQKKTKPFHEHNENEAKCRNHRIT